MGRVALIMVEKIGQFVSGLEADHGAAVRKYLERTLRSPQDAADIVQEACLKLLRLANPDEVTHPRALFFQTAFHVATDWRRRRKDSNVIPLSAESDQVADEQPTPEKTALDRELHRLLKTVIDELPDRRREVFVGHYIQGESQADIAAALGIARSTVDQHLYLGREHCRRRLRELAGDDLPGEQS